MSLSSPNAPTDTHFSEPQTEVCRSQCTRRDGRQNRTGSLTRDARHGISGSRDNFEELPLTKIQGHYVRSLLDPILEAPIYPAESRQRNCAPSRRRCQLVHGGTKSGATLPRSSLARAGCFSTTASCIPTKATSIPHGNGTARPRPPQQGHRPCGLLALVAADPIRVRGRRTQRRLSLRRPTDAATGRSCDLLLQREHRDQPCLLPSRRGPQLQFSTKTNSNRRLRPEIS